MPVPGICAMAFGGAQRDILYVLAGSTIINSFSGEVVGHVSGTSLFAITGLNASGPKSVCLKL